MVTRSDYDGREQSYVKHVFLETYLERLFHKTASVYSHVVFVDGFAGPWQSADEAFKDTSFGIGLRALRQAKAQWKNHGREISVSAHLVEKNAEAYNRLTSVSAKFPDVAVTTHHADFLGVVGNILKAIPRDAFTFFFVDPKGWNIPLDVLQPILSRPKSEVIFTFMHDFINRAANMRDADASLNALIPHKGWREKLEASVQPKQRIEILIDAFRESLIQAGGFKYVLETAVLRPVKDRPLYFLFYGTRHEAGLEVFRDCQVAALEQQAETRAEMKLKHAEVQSGQAELFQSLREMGPDNTFAAYLAEEQARAEATFLTMTPAHPHSIEYQNLWPLILSRHAVRRVQVNVIAAKLKKTGLILIPEMERRQRIPQPKHRVHRA